MARKRLEGFLKEKKSGVKIKRLAGAACGSNKKAVGTRLRFLNG